MHPKRFVSNFWGAVHYWAAGHMPNTSMPASGRMALSLSLWAQQTSTSMPTPNPRSSLSTARQS